MATGVYKLTNMNNGKVYIGASIDIKRRMKEHFKPSRVSALKHLPLYKDIDRYGKEAFDFEILEEVEANDLDAKEEHYIKKFNAVEKGYNISQTAHNMHDDKLKQIYSQKLSERNKANWQNEDYRKTMSENSKAYQATLTNDQREAAIKGLNKYTDSIKQPVAQYDKQGNLIAVFDGVREAERALNLSNDTVGKVCRGEKGRKTAGGFVWKFHPSKCRDYRKAKAE